MDVQERITELEKQVKGLMDTVTRMHSLFSLDKRGMPRPDQFTDNKVEIPPWSELVRIRSDTKNAEEPSKGSTETPTRPAAEEKEEEEVEEEVEEEIEEDPSKLEPYEYTPLDRGSRQIRYFTLEPGDEPDDPVRIQLSTANVLNFSRDGLRYGGGGGTCFMTLSYQWGDPSDPQPIVVNGKLLRVTRNLHKALLYFRNLGAGELGPGGGPRFALGTEYMWWVDAICINQEDLDEKGSQVQLMTAIYRNAAIVHVWLGEEADDSDRAMALIRKLGREPSSKEMAESQYVRKPGQTLRYLGPGLDPERLPDDPVPISDEEKDKNYRSIVKLIGRKYFTRIWIRQEIALPKDVRFHCGSQTLAWDEMMNAISILTFLTDDHCLPNLQRFKIRDRGSAISIFRRAEELKHLRAFFTGQKRHSEIEGGYLPLRGVLFHARNADATDNRDKVFAMLPLVSPDETTFKVDYRKPYREVYKEVALDLCRTSLDFFSACQNKGNYGLPSWVPDFSKGWSFLPLIMRFGPPNMDRIKDFRNSKPKTEYLAEHNVLRCCGMVFDQIAAVSSAIADTDDLSLPALESLIDTWSDFYLEERVKLNAALRAEPEWISRGFEDRYVDKRYEPYGRIYYDFSFKKKWTVWRFFNEDDYGSSFFQLRGGGREFATHPLGRTVQERLMTGSLAGEIRGSLCNSKESPWQETAARARSLFVGRKMAGTRFGAFGLMPGNVQVGDRIAQFEGSGLTYIVRQRGNDGEGQWSLLGDARRFFPQMHLLFITNVEAGLCDLYGKTNGRADFINGIEPLQLRPKPIIRNIDLV